MKLIYFKTSGKYYNEATIPDPPHFFETGSVVRSLDEQGKLPGLRSGRWTGTVLAVSEADGTKDVPVMVFLNMTVVEPDGNCVAQITRPEVLQRFKD